MRNGVAISYGDIAVGAKENAVVTSDSKADFVDLNELKEYNLNVKNYGNPCEWCQTLLDGSQQLLPDNLANENMGFWSKEESEGDGAAGDSITLKTSQLYACQGFTITFDVYNNMYCDLVTIVWLNKGETISRKYFYPDNAVYFCHNYVEGFDEVRFYFNSTNVPYNRVKVRAIDYGYGTFFYGDELRNVKLIQEIDPISSTIAINTCDFTLDSKSDIVYSFRQRQPLSVYFNGELKATTFVRNSKRKAERLWSVQSEDYIGLLDRVAFPGGIYVNKSAIDLFASIFDTADVPYSLDVAYLKNITLSGYIPYTTCRDALMQVAFATMMVVDTSNSDKVNVSVLNRDISQTVDLQRIMQGQNFDEEETVTAVEVTEHSYKPIQETLTAYEANESGTGKDVFVRFTEPLHSLQITNGTISESGNTYAVITANAGCVLTGKKYEHLTRIRRKDNMDVLADDADRVIAIENATLVSASNSSSVLNNCFDWLIRTNQTNLKIVEGKHIIEGEVIKYGQRKFGTFRYRQRTPSVITYDKPINTGEIIEAKTIYLGSVNGTVIKQTFALSGGIIVKDVVLR